MSLIDRLKSKILCVGLEPGKLTVALRVGRSFRTEASFQETLSNPDEHWRLPLAALQAYLQGAEGKVHRAPWSVMLSSCWCRMMVVPWSDALMKPEPARQFLQAQYAALYGESARDWTFTTDDSAYGQPRLACAIDTALLDAIMKLAAGHGRGCIFLEPVLSAGLRALNRLNDQGLSAFTVVEDDCLSLVSTSEGRITALHAQQRYRAESLTRSDLARSWERWALRAPHIANTTEIGVIDLTGKKAAESFPGPFKPLDLPLHGLPSHFVFVASGTRQ